MQVKKEDRRVRRTKKMLTQALTQLLQQKKEKEITVKELTDLADVNRSTFYLYYKDIPDMMKKIQDELFETLDAIFEGREASLPEHVRSILQEVFLVIEDNKELCKVLLSPNGDMNFLHRLNEVLREKCFKFWMHSGIGGNEVEFEYSYNFMVFGCAGMIRAWLSRDCLESAEQMVEMAEKTIMRGSLLERA